MDERKKKILDIIIKEHIDTAQPVGSTHLVNKYDLGVSSATVRNIMADLEEEGYIAQPHTSAGRIPTEDAYRLILLELKSKKLKEQELNEINEKLNIEDEYSFKEVAKSLSSLSNAAVFWAFHKNNLYYTGISNLFHQPEFRETEVIFDVSEVIDRMDEIIVDIYDDIEEKPKILVGSDNPFGNFCSTILVKYRLNNKSGVFGILAPMRMDYERNLALIEHILNKLQS